MGRTVARPTQSRVESVFAVTFWPSPLKAPSIRVETLPMA